MKSHITRTLGLLFLFVFICLSIGIQMKTMIQFDRQSMAFIQQYIPSSLDTPLSFFSLLGSFEVTTLILCAVLYLRKKMNGFIIFGFYGAGLVIELIGKNFLMHPGPPKQFFRYELDFLFPTSKYQTGNSFPSGHALRATFLVVVFFVFTLQSKQRTSQQKTYTALLLFGMLGSMLVSRVSLGEHWSSDVLAGAALGAGTALLSLAETAFSKRILQRLRAFLR
jgi:membrane-associated phospholipid phosphatase